MLHADATEQNWLSLIGIIQEMAFMIAANVCIQLFASLKIFPAARLCICWNQV